MPRYDRYLQWFAVPVCVAGWLYILVFTLHLWSDRIFFGGFILIMVTTGLLFDRWRFRGDRLARLPFFAGVAAFVAAILVASISPREFITSGIIGAAGTVAAWGVRAVLRSE